MELDDTTTTTTTTRISASDDRHGESGRDDADGATETSPRSDDDGDTTLSATDKSGAGADESVARRLHGTEPTAAAAATAPGGNGDNGGGGGGGSGGDKDAEGAGKTKQIGIVDSNDSDPTKEAGKTGTRGGGRGGDNEDSSYSDSSNSTGTNAAPAPAPAPSASNPTAVGGGGGGGAGASGDDEGGSSITNSTNSTTANSTSSSGSGSGSKPCSWGFVYDKQYGTLTTTVSPRVAYSIKFINNWLPNTQVHEYPLGIGPNFGPQFVVSHDSSYHLWRENETVTDKLGRASTSGTSVASRGRDGYDASTLALIDQVNSTLTSQGGVGSFVVGPAWRGSMENLPLGPPTLKRYLPVDSNHTKMSVFLRLDPSPCWFTGFDSVDLTYPCSTAGGSGGIEQEECWYDGFVVELYPYTTHLAPGTHYLDGYDGGGGSGDSDAAVPNLASSSPSDGGNAADTIGNVITRFTPDTVPRDSLAFLGKDPSCVPAVGYFKVFRVDSNYDTARGGGFLTDGPPPDISSRGGGGGGRRWFHRHMSPGSYVAVGIVVLLAVLYAVLAQGRGRRGARGGYQRIF